MKISSVQMNNSIFKKFLLPLTLGLVVALGSCDKDTKNEPNSPQVIPNPPQPEPQGVYVLSEGNFMNETGTLLWIDPKGNVQDSVYYRANAGARLGNVSQDLTLANGKIYIISQNGEKNGGKGMLYILDAKTHKEIKVFTQKQLAKLKYPTHVAVVGSKIYLRDRDRVWILDEQTGVLNPVPGTEKAEDAPMAVIGNRVYTGKGSKLLSLESGNLLETITIEGGGSFKGIKKASETNLWLATKKKNTFVRVSLAPSITQEVHTVEDEIGPSWGGHATPFALKDDVLYYSPKGDGTIKTYNAKTRQTKQIMDVKTFVPDAKMYYNSLAVDPQSGLLYYASLLGFSSGNFMQYKRNNVSIFDISGAEPKLLKTIEGKAFFPAGVYPVSAFSH